MNFDELLRQILGQAGALVVLAVATYFLMAQLTKERDNRIKLLEAQSSRCAEDRIELHKEINSLQAEVRELYKSALAGDFPNTNRQPKP